MLIHMLIVDGVKYKLWTPKDEEKEFHPLVKKNYKQIFGEDALYFDLKQKLSSKAGLVGIPDAYVITLTEPRVWYIVENELSSHDVYRHIVGQATEFMDLIDELENQRELVKIFCNEIEQDKKLEGYVRKRINTEIFRCLTELLSTPPKIAVIIDNVTPKLGRALNRLNRIANTEVVEFKTYIRENAENVKAHLFEPVHAAGKAAGRERKGAATARPKVGAITSQASYTLPILETIIEMGGNGRMSDVLEGVFKRIEDKLTAEDLEKLSSGIEVRWKNKAQWERQRLKTEGYLKKDSPRGYWEITDEGRKFYENLKGKQ